MLSLSQLLSTQYSGKEYIQHIMNDDVQFTHPSNAADTSKDIFGPWRLLNGNVFAKKTQLIKQELFLACTFRCV